MAIRELAPHFHYDDIFGTVFNRFIVQAVAGIPLTVYGKGGQMRGYLEPARHAAMHRACHRHAGRSGELRVFNQFVETFSVNRIAELVQRSGARNGLSVEVKSLPNPRKEMEEHYYNPAHTGLTSLGLEPHRLDDATLDRLMQLVMRYRNSIVPERIFSGMKWKA